MHTFTPEELKYVKDQFAEAFPKHQCPAVRYWTGPGEKKSDKWIITIGIGPDKDKKTGVVDIATYSADGNLSPHPDLQEQHFIVETVEDVDGDLTEHEQVCFTLPQATKVALQYYKEFWHDLRRRPWSNAPKYTKEVLEPVVAESSTLHEVVEKLGVDKNNAGYIRRKIEKFEISMKHFRK